MSVQIAMYSVRLINSAVRREREKNNDKGMLSQKRTITVYLPAPFYREHSFINYDVFRLVYKTFFLLSNSFTLSTVVVKVLIGAAGWCVRKIFFWLFRVPFARRVNKKKRKNIYNKKD